MFQYFSERFTKREPTTGLRFFCIALVIFGMLFISSITHENRMYAEAPLPEDNLMSTNFTFKPGEYLGKGLTATGVDSTGDTEKDAKTLGGLAARTILNLLTLGCLVMTAVAGILMVTSSGNTDRAEKGKSMLIACGSALVIALLSNGLIRVILYLIAA
ncbi:MAG: hypothetical protein U0518_02525 [Candidatus Gracilibacteria bacterium]